MLASTPGGGVPSPPEDELPDDELPEEELLDAVPEDELPDELPDDTLPDDELLLFAPESPPGPTALTSKPGAGAPVAQLAARSASAQVESAATI